MNYFQSLAYLNSFYDLEKTMRLPASRRWKLERMRHLLELFDHPEKSFLPIIIVGTKGKGSTGFFLQSIFNKAGIVAGFYSSPHLESPLERIRIKGKMISTRLWSKILTRIKKTLESQGDAAEHRGSFTYFEIMTLMAALAFKETAVQAAVFEAGMGGRLDAVNALSAPVVIVTPIHLDHQEFLGETIREIAEEKAAVIHAGNHVILMPQVKAAERMIRKRALRVGAVIRPVRSKVSGTLGLLGEHQAWNAAAAVLASEVYLQAVNQPSWKTTMQKRRAIFEKAVRDGLALRNWPGRFEVLPGKPTLVLDGAHNPASIDVLAKTLVQTRRVAARRRSGSSEVLVFGVTSDKDSQGMLETLARIFSIIITVPLPSGRGKASADLVQEASALFKTVIPAQTYDEALEWGRCIAGASGTLVITGSFYLVGAMRSKLSAKGFIQ